MRRSHKLDQSLSKRPPSKWHQAKLGQSETRLRGEPLGLAQLTANKGPKTSLLLSPGATLQAHGGSGNGSEHPLINGLV